MIKSKISKLSLFLVVAAMGCTKLDENLNSTLTNTQTANALGSAGVGLLLQAAYGDLRVPFTNQDQLFSLEENTADESLVPTRGGDWDDNGVWRVLHAHTWTADHGQILSVFNNLNKLNFDATNVLQFGPSKQQAAEARFLRALSLYYLLDLYGQYPFRNPGDNLLNAPEVKSGAAAAQFIIDELNAVVPDLPAFNNNPGQATQEAAKMLLMKCYLNRGAWANRQTPTFADADMQQVITLGNSIITGAKFSYASEYFKNFDVDNGTSTENIFTYVNTSGAAANNSGPQARWEMTLHYNQYTPKNPNAGWNGFSTISDFYNSFGTTATPTTATSDANRVNGFFTGVGAINNPDAAIDSRIGNRAYPGVTNVSGLRPGFLIGQQYNENNVALKDRKGNPLAFDPKISTDMKETGANLEVTGIRVIKYPPDFSAGDKYFQGPAGNDMVIFRYSDVVLMVAEAKLRAATADNAGALTMVNTLRAARKAQPLPSISLVNANNIYDPNTLLTERGRELYWESVRRTDLIRFGVYLKPWQYKSSDDPKNLVFPIPSQALAANPNLKQNTGY
ncbi:RagB/SusD family nutrient uptake outer membrane protein [Flavisolibacter nicotianae]|uniref:RagB/SusD family nutrient uptake outer membrane protein n=1 Tax=Flavisolibacter nicotianae TaxID=2364882 RepID=UPI000EB4486B|nr:RagB/SusD family nutrient uptake outer membrane protein [Flavisolibacter nicotianae]